MCTAAKPHAHAPLCGNLPSRPGALKVATFIKVSFLTLVIEPRVSHVLRKHCATELYFEPLSIFLL